MSSTEPIKSEINELFKAINAEVTWLHTVWELFIQLYGTSDENFEIMNATAPQFFGILKTILFDEMLMILNRLIDPPVTSGQANASLEQLIKQIDKESQTELIASLQSKLENIRTNYVAFRTWRNKRVSHNDLATILEEKGNSLPGITRGQVDTAIREIALFINEFSLTTFDSEQKYVPFLVAQGDAKTLLQFLRESLDKKVKEA